MTGAPVMLSMYINSMLGFRLRDDKHGINFQESPSLENFRHQFQGHGEIEVDSTRVAQQAGRHVEADENGEATDKVQSQKTLRTTAPRQDLCADCLKLTNAEGRGPRGFHDISRLGKLESLDSSAGCLLCSALQLAIRHYVSCLQPDSTETDMRASFRPHDMALGRSAIDIRFGVIERHDGSAWERSARVYVWNEGQLNCRR